MPPKSRQILPKTLIMVLWAVCSPLTSQADPGDKLSEMISPISNPVNFEDPRVRTELRPLYAYHDLNDDFATGGGSVNAFAAQARVALTERLGFIAVKDGFVSVKPDGVLPDSDGSLNLEAGFKYAVYMDREEGDILSVGLKYQLASGDPEVYQGVGDGIITPFVSGATTLDQFHLMAMSEMHLPVDNADSTFWNGSLHADYKIANFYPTVELNLFHVVDDGKRLPIDGEGLDLFNFGSSKSKGETAVSMAVGARYRFCDWLDSGLAFEFALTDDSSIFGNRLYVDFIISAPNWTVF